MTEKTAEWYQKEIGDRFQHFYMQLDGSYNFPNSLEGDLLKMTHKMLNLMEKKDQPTFVVGEYYADDHGHIVRIDKITIGHITASKLCDGQITQTAFTFWLAKDVLKPANAEQIASFQRAEQEVE